MFLVVDFLLGFLLGGGGASKGEVGGKDDFLQIVEVSLIMLLCLAI